MTDFYNDMKDFAKLIEKDECNLFNALKAELSKPVASEIEMELKRQAATLPNDLEKFKNGQMSYAEMRMLYG